MQGTSLDSVIAPHIKSAKQESGKTQLDREEREANRGHVGTNIMTKTLERAS